MARTMFGFKKYVPTANIITDIKRMAENFVKTHTEEGEVIDPNVYSEAISILAPYSDDLTVSNKIADYKNKIEKLQTKIEDAENSRVVFGMELQKSVSEAISQNYSDPRGLFFKMAELYGVALDEYDERVLNPTLSNLPKGQNVPQAILDMRDDLKQKSNNLINLANSYLTIDPETELAGPSNPDIYGIMIQTNPETGAIVNLDVGMVTSLMKAPTGYQKTESRFGRIPIYLNTYTEGKEELAKLGGVIYEYDSGDKMLKIQEGFVAGAMGGLTETVSRWVRAIGKETKKGVKQLQQEFPLSQIPFDFFNIPPENVVRDGAGTHYYYDKEGMLWRAENADLLRRYLREIGKNASDVDDKFYLGHPDFITQRHLPDENGKERVIDEDFFEGAAVKPTGIGAGAGPTLPVLPLPTWTEVPVKETPPKVKPSPEYTPEGYEPGKIIKKGEKFFKPLLEPLGPIIEPFRGMFK